MKKMSVMKMMEIEDRRIEDRERDVCKMAPKFLSHR